MIEKGSFSLKRKVLFAFTNQPSPILLVRDGWAPRFGACGFIKHTAWYVL